MISCYGTWRYWQGSATILGTGQTHSTFSERMCVCVCRRRWNGRTFLFVRQSGFMWLDYHCERRAYRLELRVGRLHSFCTAVAVNCIDWLCLLCGTNWNLCLSFVRTLPDEASEAHIWFQASLRFVLDKVALRQVFSPSTMSSPVRVNIPTLCTRFHLNTSVNKKYILAKPGNLQAK